MVREKDHKAYAIVQTGSSESFWTKDDKTTVHGPYKDRLDAEDQADAWSNADVERFNEGNHEGPLDSYEVVGLRIPLNYIQDATKARRGR